MKKSFCEIYLCKSTAPAKMVMLLLFLMGEGWMFDVR